MVEHELRAGHGPDRRDGRRQLGFAYEQVEDQARLADGAQAAQHVGPQQPARIGFALDDVAQTDQRRAAGPSRQRRAGRRGRAP